MTKVLMTKDANSEFAEMYWADAVIDLDKVSHIAEVEMDSFDGLFTNCFDEYGETIFTLEAKYDDIKAHFIKAKSTKEVYLFNRN
jgi:hypothetical protein